MRKNNWPFLIVVVILIATICFFGSNQSATINPGKYYPVVYSTIWSLLPPAVAIVLALITKEVYSSLFAGIIVGALLYANSNLELMLNTFLFHCNSGMITLLSDSWNVGILVFIVILSIIVTLMDKAGGSSAFGIWATKNIKGRISAQLATVLLSVLIFIDDYFACLTVGSVMRPLTDRYNISRAKLAYLIDATAAPICIIAPVSSWAAAVTSSIPADIGVNGFTVFLNTIPYNFYALTTLLMIILIPILKCDFGPMKIHEKNAASGDLFTTANRPYYEENDNTQNYLGSIWDLICPVAVLILCCIYGMIYTGGYFNGTNFMDAFTNANVSKGLVFGSFITLLIVFIWYMARGVMTFKEFTDCIPEGFKSVVVPILILIMAWTLSGMTNLLGAKFYVHDLTATNAVALKMFLPFIIFVTSLVLGFATGTSWGTFSILIPIVCSIFTSSENYEMLIISISACLAGTVCGDHCSPISDTTILASAGARCDHINHVTTQLPYAILAAANSAWGYLLAGIFCYTWQSHVALISLPITLGCMVLSILIIKKVNS